MFYGKGVKKEEKKQSKRLKNSYKDLELKEKSNFLIRQTFIKKNHRNDYHSYYWFGKYHQNLSVRDNYKDFKRKNNQSNTYNKYREYTPFPKRFAKLVTLTPKEIKIEKKYFPEKVVFYKETSKSRFFSLKGFQVDDAEFLSLFS
jgi:hypothetical protein